jgi:DNA-binding NarL/FixJ family response regulator
MPVFELHSARTQLSALSALVDSEPPAPIPSTDEPRVDRKKPIRILIVDDHEAVRRGLRSALLGAGWQVCGEASNGREAIAKTMELHPDLVVLDVSMPLMGGLEEAPQILRSEPNTKVVIFTMHESQQIKNEMMSLGVHGLAVKSAPLGNLLQTIKNVLGD